MARAAERAREEVKGNAIRQEKNQTQHRTVEQSRAQRIECDIKCNRPIHKTVLERARTQ